MESTVIACRGDIPTPSLTIVKCVSENPAIYLMHVCNYRTKYCKASDSSRAARSSSTQPVEVDC